MLGWQVLKGMHIAHNLIAGDFSLRCVLAGIGWYAHHLIDGRLPLTQLLREIGTHSDAEELYTTHFITLTLVQGIMGQIYTILENLKLGTKRMYLAC